MAVQDHFDFNNQSLRRDISRALLTPRSNGGDEDLLEGSCNNVLEDSHKIVINKKGLTHIDVFMKMKDQQQLYFSKRNGNYLS